MLAHPFNLVGQSTLQAIQRRLQRATAVWAAEWGVVAGRLDVDVDRASETAMVADTAFWSHSALAEGRAAWFSATDAFVTEVRLAVFGLGLDGAARIADTGAREALEALLDTLAAAALGCERSVPRTAEIDVPDAVWLRGAGAVVARIACGSQQCTVLLDGAAARTAQPPPTALPRLSPVDHIAGVSKAPVALQLRIGGARVGLDSLLTLAAGDVIRLDARSDAPVGLRTAEGELVFDAHLGRTGDNYAVELVRPVLTPPPDHAAATAHTPSNTFGTRSNYGAS